MHRYGRHGPRAWIRWRKRHFTPLSLLPVPVKQRLMIFRIHVPKEAERAVIVVTQDDSDSVQTIHVGDPMTEPNLQIISPEPKENKVIKAHAGWAADKANKQIKQYSEENRFILVRKPVLEQKLGECINKCIRDYFPDVGPKDSEYTQLSTEYYDLFYDEFSLEALSNTKAAIVLENSLDERIWQLATEESRKPVIYLADKRREYHLRDKGLLLIAKEFGYYSVDEAISHLDVLHPLADKFDMFVSNQGKEIVWPSANWSF